MRRSLAFIRRQVPRGTELYADEAGAWNTLDARYTMHRINHEEAYSLGGEYEINTNSAESFFSRMRRGEVGHHHQVAGPYLIVSRKRQRGERITGKTRTASRSTASGHEEQAER